MATRVVPTTFDDIDRRLGITEVWARGYRGQGVTVAVMDSGVVADAAELQGALDGAYDLTGDGDPNDSDVAPHGTAVAGAVRMVAPQARIASFKVLPRPQGFGLGSRVRDSLVRALTQCTAEFPRFRVINISLSLGRGLFGWRCRPRHPCAVCRAVDRAAEAGIVVTAAAGNYGPAPDTIECPGLAQGAITVGASLSAAEQAVYANSPEAHVFFGTSFAAPQVAGGAALLLSAVPHASPNMIRAALKSTARPLPNAPENAQGAGLPHFGRALRMLIGPSASEFDEAERRLYAVVGNADAQRPDNRFVTDSLQVALDYIDKSLIGSGQGEAAAQALERIRGYLVPGRLAAYEQSIRDRLDRIRASSR